MSVYKKLQACRVALQSSQMKKSGHNKFAGYDYFELADFLMPINVLFSECGLCSVISFTAEMATLRIVDVEDGKEIVFTSPMAEANLKGCHPIQNLGAVETYQRRYLYMLALEIVEHDALDSSKPLDETKESAKSNFKAAQDATHPEVLQKLTDKATEIKDLYDVEGPAIAYENYVQVRDSLEDAQHKAAFRGMFSSEMRTAFQRLYQAEKHKEIPL